jgi:predicted DNA-binding transcriptional regulator AlpA
MKAEAPQSLLITFDTLLKTSGLTESHQARVMSALRKGPRISTRELATHCGVHRCTVWGWVKAGKIPYPRKDGHRRRTWAVSEVSGVM